MRIVAGSLGGRSIDAPATLTRPMSQKVRAALFNILGDVTAKTVLDLYAGSGGEAIEALSRGAASAVFVEANPKAAKVIKENLTALNLNATVFVQTAQT